MRRRNRNTIRGVGLHKRAETRVAEHDLRNNISERRQKRVGQRQTHILCIISLARLKDVRRIVARGIEAGKIPLFSFLDCPALFPLLYSPASELVVRVTAERCSPVSIEARANAEVGGAHEVEPLV